MPFLTFAFSALLFVFAHVSSAEELSDTQRAKIQECVAEYEACLLQVPEDDPGYFEHKYYKCGTPKCVCIARAKNQNSRCM